MMPLTEEQGAVVDHEIEEGGLVKVRAYAGTGKTTTFVEFANAIYPTPALYLAFNKSVETEAKGKFPSNVRCKTVHALAWAECGKDYEQFGEVRYFDVQKRLKLDVYAATLVCKTLDNFLNSADDKFVPAHCAPDVQKRYKVDITDDMLKSANVIWQSMIHQIAPFRMTHSGYLKLYQLSKPRIPQPFIMLDEAQDTNPVTFDIVNRQRQFGTRVLMAGDSYQQIYSWRGAVDAMHAVDCKTFMLTQSFRFGENVAMVANKLLSTFFGETVPLVGRGPKDELVRNFPENEIFTIICRTNCELFSQAVDQVSLNRKLHVIGDQSFAAFLQSIMDVYYVFDRQPHLIQNKSLTFFKNYEALKKFAVDRLDLELLSRISIVDRYQSSVPRHVENVKKANVGQRHANVVLVTAHKSKGLEWDNVKLANDFDDLFDDQGKLRRTREQVLADETLKKNPKRLQEALDYALDKDEVNLLYVAATRAKRRLMINGELAMLLNGKPANNAPASAIDDYEDDEDEEDEISRPDEAASTRG